MVFSDPNEPDCVKRLNLSTYKSDWLKVHTLLEMGIEFFLNPESRWSVNTPEAVEFWEKGKDARRSRYIGTTVGDSNPSEYVGRVLDKLDIKRKCDRVRSDAGQKIRVYRVDTDYLLTPMRSAVYECVKQRVESVVQADSLVLNWDAIVENSCANETAQKLGIPMLETPDTQVIEVGHLPPNFSINQGEGVPLPEGSEVEEVAEALPYCDTLETFAAVIEHYSDEVVEDAIALQDTQHSRSQLRQWLEGIRGTYSEAVHEKKPLGVMLVDAFQQGLDVFRHQLGQLNVFDRWVGIEEFEQQSPAKMLELMGIAPEWEFWCSEPI